MNIGEPRIVVREAQHYVAVRRQVTIPFNDHVDPAMSALFGAVHGQDIKASGPVFFKYNIVNMPELEVEFAIEVAIPVAATGELLAGTLPAGRYAELTFHGPYAELINANAALLDWVRAQGLVLDSSRRADGEHFAARLEIYVSDPNEEPDPEKLETVVAMKLRD